MERLTKEGKFCDVIECELTPGGSFCERGTCTERRLWERLSFIEDILGNDYDLDRLRELVEADREGRCGDIKNRCAIYGKDDEDGLSDRTNRTKKTSRYISI
ncbi:MAG: hypothetical protein ACOX85_02880 [Candidatus Pararuminococcus gallinarum]|jgi:hypothetical protein